MGSSATAGPEQRMRLTRGRVLRAAIGLADAGGLEALTMCKLGDELEVEAMSVYHHVANKDDLLDGMIDAVFAEVELPPPSDNWKTAIRKRSTSLRAALSRHPWATGLMVSGSRPSNFTLRHHDRVLGTLRNGGFSFTLAAHAFSVIDSYVYGFSMQDTRLPFESELGPAAMANTMLVELDATEFPYLTELIRDKGLRSGAEFHYALDLILDALERDRERELQDSGSIRV